MQHLVVRTGTPLGCGNAIGFPDELAQFVPDGFFVLLIMSPALLILPHVPPDGHLPCESNSASQPAHIHHRSVLPDPLCSCCDESLRQVHQRTPLLSIHEMTLSMFSRLVDSKSLIILSLISVLNKIHLFYCAIAYSIAALVLLILTDTALGVTPKRSEISRG